MAETTRVMVCAALALLTGCASQGQLQQADLAALKRSLPGVYGNEAPTLAHAVPGGPSTLAVTVSITPVGAQLIGDAVYFVRETAADNTRLVLLQGIWALTLDPHTGVVQQSFLFKEPRRWLGAADDPDLLVSLLPADLQLLPGCELTWQKSPTGWQTSEAPPASPPRGGKRHDTGAASVKPESQACRPGRAAADLWIERRASLVGNELTLQEQRTAANGELESAEPPLSLILRRAAASNSTSP